MEKLGTLELKEHASRTFADVANATKLLFPEERYRPTFAPGTNVCLGIDPHPHTVFGNSDGVGTKPELAERLATFLNDPKFFRTLARDLIAMIADDAARDGRFVVGIMNSVDPNMADPEMMAALAAGMREACEEGRFPLLNGETAELGYRTAGYGDRRVNWNAAALQIVNKEKIIDGRRLRPGQPIVGFRETSIRSNGLSRARAIMERAHIGRMSRMEHIVEFVRGRVGDISPTQVEAVLRNTPMGNALLQYIQVPWHEAFLELTEELLKPSRLYSPLMYEAQGGVDGTVRVPVVNNAHISGGGIPRKAKRMMERAGLGVRIDKHFPDPVSVERLMQLAKEHPDPNSGQPLVNERSASIQWNRGIGFLSVVERQKDADNLLRLAEKNGYEAMIVGETIEEPLIHWRGETWTYDEAEAAA